MKKIILILGVLAVFSLFISCGDIEDTDISEDSETSESDIIDYEDTFTSIDELGKFIIQNKDSDFEKLFEHPAQKNNSSAVTIYELADIPENYYLSDIRKASYAANISTCYKNNANDEQITFVWYFADDGEKYLENCRKGSEIPEMSGYYSEKVNDDNGIEIYQIFWAEDGYCFQLNIPVKLFDEEYKEKDSVELEKVEFPIIN